MRLISSRRAFLAGTSRTYYRENLTFRFVHASAGYRQKTESQPSSTAPRPVSEIPNQPNPVVSFLQSLVFDLLTQRKHLHTFLLRMHEGQPITRFRGPGTPPVVMITQPEDFEKLMKATAKNPVRPNLESSTKIRLENEYFEKKGGIVQESGEEWWRVRSRVQTPMMKPKIVQSYLQQMDEVALDFTDRIADLQSKFGEMPSDFQSELYKWGFESVGVVALNRRLGCLDPTISEDSEPLRMIKLTNTMLKCLNDTDMGLKYWKVFPSPAYRKLKECQYEFLELAKRNISQTEEALKTRPSDEEKELTLMEQLLLTPGLTHKDIVTLIVDMLGAGIHTTTHTAAFVLYLLARNPEAQAKLQKEIDTVLDQHQGPLLPKHVAKLTYMKAVLKESLRLFPITLGNTRLLEEDIELGGYLIPKGHMVMAVHAGHDEKQFPRAKEFLPERWLRDRPLGPIHPYASLPFSTGTRMCIGRRIAEQEIYTLLARVMQRFSIDYKHEDIGIHTVLLASPSRPLKFTFTERN